MPTYDPGAVNYGLNSAFQTKFGRGATAAETSQFQGATGFDWTKPLSQEQYDQAIGMVSNYSGGPPVTGAGAGAGAGAATGGGAGTAGAAYSGAAPMNTPAPAFTAPRPELPTAVAPPDFTYGAFGGLSWDQALAKDPGIAARLARGGQAIQHSASAQGTMFSPNTMAGLIDYNQEAASNEYGSAYDREFGQWKTGYDTSADTYRLNYGVDRDTFDRNYGRAMDQYGADLTGAQLEYAPGLLSWQRQNQTSDMGYDREWQNYLYGRDDAFRRKVHEENRWDTNNFYDRDDEWRRYVENNSQNRFMAELGAR